MSSKAYLVGNETLVASASVATEAEENQEDWQTVLREPQHDGVNVVKQSDLNLIYFNLKGKIQNLL